MSDYLKKYPNLTAGIANLFPFQLASISSLLNHKNTLTIAPTGKGKSVIYQITAMELEGITIIIAPLTALINEQVGFLQGVGIHAVSLTSEIKFADQRIFLRNLAISPPKILFISPERLQNAFFRAALIESSLPISMVVIDEAHCISQWGIDFRPDYAQIPGFISFLKINNIKPVILALTATLGSEARTDIIDAYQINANASFIEQNTIRPELHLHFLQIDVERRKDEKVLEILKTSTFKKGIIYFYVKTKCDKVAKHLIDEGFEVATYHADLERADKRNVYEGFVNNEYQLLCATTAFGMGMNIPDIDLIIHYHITNSIEEYYQQVGRAARDKNICPSAECYLLWSEKNFDYKLNEHILPQALNLEKINESFRKFGLENNSGRIEAIRYSSYVAQNLSRFRYLFEKYGIIQFIGEVYGSPGSIVFKKANPYWDGIINKMGYGNEFVRAAENSKLTLQQLIDYIFKEELAGKIKIFHVMERKLFFKSEFDEIPLEIAYAIIKESKKIIAFKSEQLQALKSMIKSENPETFIANYFE